MSWNPPKKETVAMKMIARSGRINQVWILSVNSVALSPPSEV